MLQANPIENILSKEFICQNSINIYYSNCIFLSSQVLYRKKKGHNAISVSDSSVYLFKNSAKYAEEVELKEYYKWYTLFYREEISHLSHMPASSINNSQISLASSK